MSCACAQIRRGPLVRPGSSVRGGLQLDGGQGIFLPRPIPPEVFRNAVWDGEAGRRDRRRRAGVDEVSFAAVVNAYGRNRAARCGRAVFKIWIRPDNGIDALLDEKRIDAAQGIGRDIVEGGQSLRSIATEQRGGQGVLLNGVRPKARLDG